MVKIKPKSRIPLEEDVAQVLVHVSARGASATAGERERVSQLVRPSRWRMCVVRVGMGRVELKAASSECTAHRRPIPSGPHPTPPPATTPRDHQHCESSERTAYRSPYVFCSDSNSLVAPMLAFFCPTSLASTSGRLSRKSCRASPRVAAFSSALRGGGGVQSGGKTLSRKLSR